MIFWSRETATLLKSNLRCFHREKSTFEKFDAGLKLRIVFYTHKTIKTPRKNFRVIYTLNIFILKKKTLEVRLFLRSNVNGNFLEVFQQNKTKITMILLIANMELRKRLYSSIQIFSISKLQCIVLFWTVNNSC